jgi:hypothetical protein
MLNVVLRTATTRLQKLKITSSLKAKLKELFETQLFHAYEIYFTGITGFLVRAIEKFHRQLRMRSRRHNCNTTLNHSPNSNVLKVTLYHMIVLQMFLFACDQR